MMKRSQRRGGAVATHPKREIKVRMTAARAAAFATAPPDVWVVNGRVIRFLDPMGPDEVPVPAARRRVGVGALLGALRRSR
ncbi:MAG TPA: hypothetical protein VGQ42_07615 [Candidatus Dormibacteraeota bacterium]|jgi:hypothetical protein|nr:hypothetical protein [Candidatus Dormibacteraeota bacterium]